MRHFGLRELDDVREHEHDAAIRREALQRLFVEAFEEAVLEVHRQVQRAAHFALHPRRVGHDEVEGTAVFAELVRVLEFDRWRNGEPTHLPRHALDRVRVDVRGDDVLEARLRHLQREHAGAGAHIDRAVARALVLREPRAEELEVLHAGRDVGAVERMHAIAQHGEVHALLVPFPRAAQHPRVLDRQREVGVVRIQLGEEARARRVRQRNLAADDGHEQALRRRLERFTEDALRDVVRTLARILQLHAQRSEDVEPGSEAIGDDQRALLAQPRRGLRHRDVLVDGLRAVAKDRLGAVQGGGHSADLDGRGEDAARRRRCDTSRSRWLHAPIAVHLEPETQRGAHRREIRGPKNVIRRRRDPHACVGLSDHRPRGLAAVPVLCAARSSRGRRRRDSSSRSRTALPSGTADRTS